MKKEDCMEDVSKDKTEEILEAYREILSLKKEMPSYRDFLSYGISRDVLRARFGGIEALHEYFRENHKDFIDSHFITVDGVFSSEKNALNSDKKVFIVTTAVANSKAHHGFLDAMKNYCKRHNAQILVMPCEAITNSFENRTGVFDPIFNEPDYLFVQEDTPLNDNISLCSIQISAKQIRPITGLTRLGNREGSYVFASPKQFLEYVPAGNKRGNNYSIMTTGSCTLPEYYSETFVSKRLSYIAEYDHKMGAIIIEIEDDKIFHFRQIQCDESGAFIDFGVKYLPNGQTRNVLTNVVFGDVHGNSVDMNALNAFLGAFRALNISNVYLHDVFDGYSISHHVKDIVEKSIRSIKGDESLEKEILETYEVIEYIDKSLKPSKINIVKSNHDEFLSRYLSSGGYINDPKNHYLSLKIATALFEKNQDVLRRGFEVVGKTVPQNWKFLSRECSSMISDVECGSHGDLGLNGAKPSLLSLEKAYGNCVVGHAHSAAIQRGVFRVGTISKLNLGYNRGPSSWTHTCCLVYNNGQRQLINNIEGKCRIEINRK
jgi:hypothetical protein